MDRSPGTPAAANTKGTSHAGQTKVVAGGENNGDRRLRPRGAGKLGASAGNGGRLGTESSVPAFSRTFVRTKGGIRGKTGLAGAPDFLSNDAPECILERLAHARDMLA
jgi:hypothetical protein